MPLNKLDLIDSPIYCYSNQSSTTPTTPMSLYRLTFTPAALFWINYSHLVKNTPVVQIKDHKGTPFDHIRKVLSTNQRAGFLALDQSEASISARFSASVDSEAIQSTPTLSMECQSDQSSANRCNFMTKHLNPRNTNLAPLEQIQYQLTVNPVLMNCHLSATGMLKTTNGVSLNYHWPIDCQSSVNELPLECHWNA